MVLEKTRCLDMGPARSCFPFPPPAKASGHEEVHGGRGQRQH